MSVEQIRAQLRSDTPRIVVDAAAGCGKTYEAAKLAADLADGMPSGRQVLLLAHTNAAVQEFAKRLGSQARVRVSTIDSFCLDVLGPYAGALQLPVPLRRQVGPGRLPFYALAAKTVELFDRAPSVAALTAARYPALILDEHQDANVVQHRVIESLARAAGERIRLRFFGDALQAIFDGPAENGLNWETLCEGADARLELDEPRRWDEVPALGEWIMRARDALENRHAIPTAGLPPCVRVRRVPRMPDVRFGHGQARYLSVPLMEFLNRAEGSAAVLTFTNNSAVGIRAFSRNRLTLNEGADVNRAYEALERVIAAGAAPQPIARLFVALLQDIATGLTQPRIVALRGALGVDAIAYPRGRDLRLLLEALQPIYDAPGPASFGKTARMVTARKPPWLRFRIPRTLWILGHLQLEGAADPIQVLDEFLMRWKLTSPRARRIASTIHKAKGLEFDHVLIPHFSTSQFPDTEMGRRLAYVAISRATKSLEVLVPDGAPSPLIA